MDVRDELFSFNLISGVCAFISLINITLLFFYTFFVSHGFYVVNRGAEYNNEINKDHRGDESSANSNQRRDKNPKQEKERRNSH